jgi:hypothetical protein
VQPDLIPPGVLFGNPTRVSPAISPDGIRLAFIAPVENRLRFYAAAERFLAQHLGGRCEPAD